MLWKFDNFKNIPTACIDPFLDKLAPIYVPNKNELPELFSNDSTHELEEQFTVEELNSVLRKVSNSSPGLDGIPS